MKKIIILIALIFATSSIAQERGSYLIQSDIGEFKYRPKRTNQVYGNSGILIPVDHFDIDHNDTTYKTRYVHPVTILGVEVQVTQHTGGDSDKWLLHEVDKEFRTYYGIPDPSYMIRTINGNTVYTFGSAGWDYRWVSGNKIIDLEYRDPMMSKAEPLEIINAYLAKHPSFLPATTSAGIRNAESKTTWIKDEMDRRLWLCDKWFMQLQLEKVTQSDTLQAAVKSMNVFLDYRQKYYGIDAAGDKNLLSGYLSANDGTNIKAKLTEYKNWWSMNRNKSIRL